MKKRESIQKMLLGKLDICAENKPEPCLSSCTTINSNLIKDLNIKTETLKAVQERTGNTLELIVIGNDFLNSIQMAQQLREKMDNWDSMKLKSFCTTKEMVSKLKGLPTERQKNLC
jgi:hypothetical protein